MSTICTDTFLEMLSPLVNCSVDNVSRNVSVQMVLSFPWLGWHSFLTHSVKHSLVLDVDQQPSPNS